MNEIHTIALVKGRVVPRDARQVETPIKGSTETILSDLVPTDAVTQAVIDSIGTATYGSIDFGNRTDPNEFSAYVLRRITADRAHAGFSRFWFTRAVEPTTPYKTITENGDFYWDPILYGIAYFVDFRYPLFTRGPDGKYIYSPRYYPRIDYVDAATQGTLFTHEHFVHTTPPVVKQQDAPLGTTVRHTFGNIDDTYQKCLHKTLVLDPKISAFAAFDEVTGSTFPASGTISGQISPRTNFVTWQSYVHSIKVVEHDLLYELIKTTVTPPPVPKPSRG